MDGTAPVTMTSWGLLIAFLHLGKDFVGQKPGGVDVGEVVHGSDEDQIGGCDGISRISLAVGKVVEVYAVGDDCDRGLGCEGGELLGVVGGCDDEGIKFLAEAFFVAFKQGKVEAIAQRFFSGARFELAFAGGIDGTVDVDADGERAFPGRVDVDFVDAMFAGDGVKFEIMDGLGDPGLEVRTIARSHAGWRSGGDEFKAALKFVPDSRSGSGVGDCWDTCWTIENNQFADDTSQSRNFGVTDGGVPERGDRDGVIFLLKVF
jgi:hypothetical protein